MKKTKTQPILIEFKHNETTGVSVVDFMIVIHSKYIIEALRVANNNLGKNQRNSGLNFESSVIKGER